MLLQCVTNAEKIALAIRMYAANWEGWQHPDPDYYVKLLDHPLKGEKGYDPLSASKVEDFLCPLDDDRYLNRHGYPSSYVVVTPLFRGSSIMSFTGDPYRIVLVAEQGRRHPFKSADMTGRRHDPSVERSPDLEAVNITPGLRALIGFQPKDLWVGHMKVRAWEEEGTAWKMVTSSRLKRVPLFRGFWAYVAALRNKDWTYPNKYEWMESGLPPNLPKKMIARWDGTVKFRVKEDIHFAIQSSGQFFFWLDTNNDGKQQDNETVSLGGRPSAGLHRVTKDQVRLGVSCRCAFVFRVGPGDDYFKISWTAVPPTTGNDGVLLIVNDPN
jgi:hypothetical protein